MKHRNFGFSLVEMAMVLAISGMMVGYALKADRSSGAKDCYVSTKVQMTTIRTAIEQFARKNDRLPLPALRTLGVQDVNYGREASSASTLASVDYNWGTIPFQALGLAPSYAADCWGNKFTYVVTNALTTNASSGGFLDRTVLGKIQFYNSSVQLNNTTAYAIISHGEDGRGAVKANATVENWCTAYTLLEDNNCKPGTSVREADFNNGKNAGANYFDDLIITSGRPQVRPAPPTANTVMGWGSNFSGEIGDGNIAAAPVPPTSVSGGRTFGAISAGNSSACGITLTNATYCWGLNGYGQLGLGDNATRNVPTLVPAFTFTKISMNEATTCGLTAAGAAYCWGLNANGQLGVGDTTDRNVPTAVIGGFTFSQISVGRVSTCGLTAAGVAYCWGYNGQGQLGVGDYVERHSPSVPVAGGHVFSQISAGGFTNCGLEAGAAWCWGYNVYGQTGDNTTTSFRPSPVATQGGLTFTKINAAENTTCGLTAAGAAYCWGRNSNGTVGDNTFVDKKVPVAVYGGLTFSTIGGTASSICGLSSGIAYCWGYNQAQGQLGDGTVTDRSVPTAVLDNHLYSQIISGTSVSFGIVATNSP